MTSNSWADLLFRVVSIPFAILLVAMIVSQFSSLQTNASEGSGSTFVFTGNAQ